MSRVEHEAADGSLAPARSTATPRRKPTRLRRAHVSSIETAEPLGEQIPKTLYGLFSVTLRFWVAKYVGIQRRPGARACGGILALAVAASGTRPGGHRVRQSHDGHCGLGDRRIPCGCAATRRVAELYDGGDGNVTRSALLARPLGLVAVSAGRWLCGRSAIVDQAIEAASKALRELSRSTMHDDRFRTHFRIDIMRNSSRADPLRGRPSLRRGARLLA